MFRDKDTENYNYMMKLLDLDQGTLLRWNVAKISPWFYKINGSQTYSVKNVRKIYNKPTFQMPVMYNMTHYQFTTPCQLSNEGAQCRRWICPSLISGFFPPFHLVYNPQDTLESEYENLYATSDVFNLALKNEINGINATTNTSYTNEIKWGLKFGPPSPEKNFTYMDPVYWGPKMVNSLKDLEMNVNGINENTDIGEYVIAMEPNIYGKVIQVFSMLFILVVSFAIFEY